MEQVYEQKYYAKEIYTAKLHIFFFDFKLLHLYWSQVQMNDIPSWNVYFLD